VNDSFGMQVVQGKDYLGKIVLGGIFIKGPDLLQEGREISTLHELHDHVEELLRLESVDPADNELIADLTEDVLFVDDILDHIFLHHFLLIQDLDGEEVICILFPCKDDLAIGSRTQGFKKDEIVY